MISSEYALDYSISGILLSILSVGYLITGAVAGYLPGIFGIRFSYAILGGLVCIGFAIIIFTGNPILLLIAMFLCGISKGASANFANQFVSNLTNSNTGALNFNQAFFAIGAFTAPIIVMFCGVSWRSTLTVVIIICAFYTVFGLIVPISPRAYSPKEKSRPDYGFFKEKLFWLCALIIAAYVAFESSLISWLVTFLEDTGTTNASIAQLLSTSLWIALFIGRLIIARLSVRFKPYQMLPVMVIGMAVCFTAILFGHNLVIISFGTIGTGLFIAGIYGTAMGNSNTLMIRYPLCMGMFIVFPGILSIITPSIVGFLSDDGGIRTGMLFLYVLVAIMVVLAIYNVVYYRRKALF